MTTRRRTKAERDETTVEIGFTVVSACFLGGLVFAAMIFALNLPPAVAGVVAGVVGLVRVVHVLWRYEERRH
ncbi:hypothetical protein QF037_009570 [Streptomyces canus]|uniref:DUF6332 family protein n=1 Tax=Streptomyces canus TaxID=58343 RepID=UPI002781FCE5|nr:DUF6332 family protein [Streptomyces canus]MDQ0605225.1 hypothetical protein [Streptomyces canus]